MSMQGRGYDLPGDSELVGQPAALHFLPAGGQLSGQPVLPSSCVAQFAHKVIKRART